MVVHEPIALQYPNLGASAPDPHVRPDILERLSDDSALFLIGEHT